MLHDVADSYVQKCLPNLPSSYVDVDIKIEARDIANNVAYEDDNNEAEIAIVCPRPPCSLVVLDSGIGFLKYSPR